MAERVEVDAEAQRSARARFAQQRLLVPGEEDPKASKAGQKPAVAPAAPRRAAAPEARVEPVVVAPEGDAAAVAIAASSLVEDMAPVDAATVGVAVAAAPAIASAEVRAAAAPVATAIGAPVPVNPAATLGVEPVEGASVATGSADSIRIATDGGAPFDVWATVRDMGSYQAAHATWWAAHARDPAAPNPAGPIPTLDVTGAPPPANTDTEALAAARPRPDTSGAADNGPRVTGFAVRGSGNDEWVIDEPMEEVAPAAPPPPPPVVVGGTARQTEYFTIYGEPETVSAVDCVTTETKLATLRQVLGPEQAAAFEELRQRPDFNLDAAFMAVLGAARLAGVHDVNIGGLVAHLTVDEATGLVNGKPLASDAELALAPRFSNLTMEQRKAELRQFGVSELFIGSAGTHQIIRAFNEIELRRMRGDTGDVSLNLATTLDTVGLGARIENTGLPVPLGDKIATIQSVLTGADRAAFDAMLATPGGYSRTGIDAAFDAILAARTTPGSKRVGIDVPLISRDWMNDTDYVSGNAHFTVSMEVDGYGRVNGQELAVDQAAQCVAHVANASPADKDQALLAAGMPSDWVQGADPATKDYALARISALSRVPGTHALDFTTTHEVTSGDGSITSTLVGLVTLQVGADGINGSNRVAFHLGADGAVSVNGRAAEQPITDAQLKDLSARETREWPGGTPEGRIRNRLEDVPSIGRWVARRDEDGGFQFSQHFESGISTGDKIAAIEGVLSGAQLEQFRALVAPASGAGGGWGFGRSVGVDPASIDAAFDALLQARQEPGSKPLNLQISRIMEGREGQFVGPPTSIGLTIDVDAQGQVNGKPLTVDTAARLASELATIPVGVKDQALLDAGFSQTWVRGASQEQKDFALGRMRALSLEPGVHTLDIPADHENWRGEYISVPGKVTLNVTADGKVNGKTQLIEAALATQLTMERMSMSEKRMLLVSFGVPTEAARNISPDEAAALLTQVAFAQRTPGEHQFTFNCDGRWQMMVRIGGDGKVEAAGAAREPKDESWRMVVSMVLTIVSIAFPVVAPVCAVIQAGLAYDSGVRGIGLVAAVAGAVAGVSGMADAAAGATTASTTTTTLSNIASVLQATSAAKNAIEGESVLGVFASVVSLASAAGNLAGQPLGADFDVLIQAGKYAGYADRIAQGDFQGLFTAAIGDAARANPVPGGGAAPAYGDREGDPPVNADGTPFVGAPGVAPEPLDDLDAPTLNTPAPSRAPAPLDDLDAPTLNTGAPPAVNGPVYGDNEGDPPVNADGTPFVGEPVVPDDVAADPYVGFRGDDPAPVGPTPGYGNNEGDPPVNEDGSPFDADRMPVTAPDGAAPVEGGAPVDGAPVDDVTPVDEALPPGRPVPFPVIGGLGEAEGVRLAAATPTPGMLMALGEFDPNKPVTVLVHQYAGEATDYQALADRLTAQGMQVMVLAYDSRGTTVVENARILNQELARLAGQMTDTSNINIVGHSMGGVVVRTALADTGALGTTGPFDHYTVRTVDSPLEGMATLATGLPAATDAAQAILARFGQAGLGELLANSAPYRLMENPLDPARVDFQQTYANEEAFIDVRSVQELARWELTAVAEFVAGGPVPDASAPGYASARNMAYTLRDDSRFGELQAVYAERRATMPDEHPNDALIAVVEQVMPRAVGGHNEIIVGNGSAGTALVDRLAGELLQAGGLAPLQGPPAPSPGAAPVLVDGAPAGQGIGVGGATDGVNLDANRPGTAAAPSLAFDDEGNLMPGQAAFGGAPARGASAEVRDYWAAQAVDRQPLFADAVPQAVRDVMVASSVQLQPMLDGSTATYASGALARVVIDGQEQVVLMTTNHTFGNRPFVDSSGAPREIDEYTLVARGSSGASVVIPTDNVRSNWNGRTNLGDGMAIVLPPEIVQQLVRPEDLARIPTIANGPVPAGTTAYVGGFPGYTSPTLDQGSQAPDTRLLVGTVTTTTGTIGVENSNVSFIGGAIVPSTTNPPPGPGQSGAGMYVVGPNGEVFIDGLYRGAAPISNSSGLNSLIVPASDPALGLAPAGAAPPAPGPVVAAPAAPEPAPAPVDVQLDAYIPETDDTQEGDALVDATEEMAAPPAAAAPAPAPAPAAPAPAPAAESDGESGGRMYAGGGSGRVGGGGGRGGRGNVNIA